MIYSISADYVQFTHRSLCISMDKHIHRIMIVAARIILFTSFTMHWHFPHAVTLQKQEF